METHTNDRKELAKYLAYLRYIHSESKTVMAEKLGITVFQLDSIERGTSHVSVDFRNCVVNVYKLEGNEKKELDRVIVKSVEHFSRLAMDSYSPALKEVIYKLSLNKDNITDKECQDILQYIDGVLSNDAE